MQGYYRRPIISKDQVYFLADDDLWKVSLLGGESIRVTSTKGRVLKARISPDGKTLCYSSDQQGQIDLYLINLKSGGVPQKITFDGQSDIIGWQKNDQLVLRTSEACAFGSERKFYRYNLRTGSKTLINCGTGADLAWDLTGRDSHLVLLTPAHLDPAWWKRYRGGTAGQLWLSGAGKTPFTRLLKNLKGNLASPVLIGKDLYFLSDHENQGNVYRFNLNSKRTQLIYKHAEFYCRELSGDQKGLIFRCGGDLYRYDFKAKKTQPIKVEFAGHKVQAYPRYESGRFFFNQANIDREGKKIALISRGKLFIGRPFKGGMISVAREKEDRFAHPCFLEDGQLFAVKASSMKSDLLISLSESGEQKVVQARKDWGKIWTLRACPKKKVLALSNNRGQLFSIHFSKKSERVDLIDTSKFGQIRDLNWSPDGRYIAYSKGIDQRRSGLFIYDCSSKKTRQLFDPVLEDSMPCFSQDGKYLFFHSVREYRSYYSEMHFSLGFPYAGSLYGVSLGKLSVLPWDDEDTQPEKKQKDKKGKKKSIETVIDWENIERRIFSLGLGIGGYRELKSAEGRLFFIREKQSNPSGENDGEMAEEQRSELYGFQLNEKKCEGLGLSPERIDTSLDGRFLQASDSSSFRFWEADKKFGDGTEFNKETGLVDLNRCRVYIDPIKEWKQIYTEAWQLQREHFWRKDLGGINWKQVFDRYFKLIDRLSTRSEFSDVLWEMQGELGASHCYEQGGDYDKIPPRYGQGRLGAELKWIGKSKCYEVISVYKGDTWIESASSTFEQLGVGLVEGDLIYALDEQTFEKPNSIYRELEHKANLEVELTVKRKGKRTKEKLTLKTLLSDKKLLYRNWVEKNKAFVHKKSNGKLGYVHIPDMGPRGFAEFYRHYLVESQFQGLVIDVRYNGGGHISQLLLAMLQQKVLGFDQTRYAGVETYPSYAVNGPMACLTNQYAGSDGDIFSHSFKLMNLGKLIGTRTWGGVIGIDFKYQLKDETRTTQPEYSFWFKDVGWKVENYGTDPDIEVVNTPDDNSIGKDRQLEFTVGHLLKELKTYKNLKLN
jgi:tricorn protease